MKLHYTQSGACVLRDQAELRVAIFRGRTFELHCYQEDGAVAMVQNCPLGCTDRCCEAWAIGAGEQDRARARDRTPWKPSTRASVQGEPEMRVTGGYVTGYYWFSSQVLPGVGTPDPWRTGGGTRAAAAVEGGGANSWGGAGLRGTW